MRGGRALSRGYIPKVKSVNNRISNQTYIRELALSPKDELFKHGITALETLRKCTYAYEYVYVKHRILSSGDLSRSWHADDSADFPARRLAVASGGAGRESRFDGESEARA